MGDEGRKLSRIEIAAALMAAIVSMGPSLHVEREIPRDPVRSRSQKKRRKRERAGYQKRKAA